LAKRARPAVVGGPNGKLKPKKFAHNEHKTRRISPKHTEKDRKRSSRVAIQS